MASWRFESHAFGLELVDRMWWFDYSGAMVYDHRIKASSRNKFLSTHASTQSPVLDQKI